MQTPTATFKITDAIPGEVISGIVPNALASLPAGILVNLANPGNTVPTMASDSVNLQLSNGIGPVYLLERDTLAVGATIPLDQLMFQDAILCPVPVGSAASARAAKFIEVEGNQLVQATGGQAITGATPINSPLTSLNGLWALQTHTATQEVCGILRAFLAPENAGNVRIYVEIVNVPLSGVAT